MSKKTKDANVSSTHSPIPVHKEPNGSLQKADNSKKESIPKVSKQIPLSEKLGTILGQASTNPIHLEVF